MNFWDNLLRYPRFFLSSMLGLFFVLVTSIMRLSKEIPNQKKKFLIFFVVLIALVWTLNQMINPDY